MIEDKFPGCNLIFPEGDENYMPNFDMNLIRAKTNKYRNGKYIGEPVFVNGMKVTPVYAMHQGGRYAIDTYSWQERGATGYVVQYKDVSIYFAGDTGYDSLAFKAIGNAFDKIDLALIPIGPCRKCGEKGMWFHTSSIEALKVFTDLKAARMVPIHYGAIQYFNDVNYPLTAMEKILQDTTSYYHAIENKVTVLKEGEQAIW